MKIIWGRSIGWNIDLQGYKKRKMEYQIVKDGADCYPWREVYAWWPRRTISGRTVWLEKVFKRKVWVVWGTGFHMEPEVEYATLFEMLADDESERYGN
jgi:hypothetical protein